MYRMSPPRGGKGAVRAVKSLSTRAEASRKSTISRKWEERVLKFKNQSGKLLVGTLVQVGAAV
jgi:hypothetical protein